MPVKVVTGWNSGEIIQKKSRFIGTIKEVHNEEDAQAFIEEIRKKYWDARHNCFAYILGNDCSLSRFSDDKEPSGTAGKPILEVLKGAGLTNACIVVTRYFGGILLGTGGLVRAYTDAANAALEGAAVSEVFFGKNISFACEYKDTGRFESLLSARGAYVTSKEYLEKASYGAVIDDDAFPLFIKDAMEITRGGFSLSGESPATFLKLDGLAVPYEF